MSHGFSGRCLCGALRFESTEGPVAAGHCQCTQCRKTSGTGHASNLMVPKAAVSVTGKATFFDARADSGNTVTRAFCPTCGSVVYALNSGYPDAFFPRASCLDDPGVFVPQMVVFAGSGVEWDTIEGDFPRFEGMPPPPPAS